MKSANADFGSRLVQLPPHPPAAGLPVPHLNFVVTRRARQHLSEEARVSAGYRTGYGQATCEAHMCTNAAAATASHPSGAQDLALHKHA